MGRSIRDSLLIWFGASIAVHIGLVWAVWNTEVETAVSRPREAERVVISLLAAPKPAPAVEELPLVESPPPVAAPPPSLPPMPPPKPAPPMAVEPPPVTAPDPPIPSTVATLAAVDSSAETARESDATPTAIASDASDADLPIDPLPDYVADVRSRIESKKRYPAMARRRSEEGLVVARVSIGTDGRVAELEIDGAGPLSLRRATRAAVENAAPFPMPPRGAVVIEVPIRWRVLD